MPIAPVLLLLEAPSLTTANFRIILCGPSYPVVAYPQRALKPASLDRSVVCGHVQHRGC